MQSNNSYLILKRTERIMTASMVRTYDHKLLQELNLTARQGAHQILYQI